MYELFLLWAVVVLVLLAGLAHFGSVIAYSVYRRLSFGPVERFSYRASNFLRVSRDVIAFVTLGFTVIVTFAVPVLT